MHTLRKLGVVVLIITAALVGLAFSFIAIPLLVTCFIGLFAGFAWHDYEEYKQKQVNKNENSTKSSPDKLPWE